MPQPGLPGFVTVPYQVKKPGFNSFLRSHTQMTKSYGQTHASGVAGSMVLGEATDSFNRQVDSGGQLVFFLKSIPIGKLVMVQADVEISYRTTLLQPRDCSGCSDVSIELEGSVEEAHNGSYTHSRSVQSSRFRFGTGPGHRPDVFRPFFKLTFYTLIQTKPGMIYGFNLGQEITVQSLRSNAELETSLNVL